MIIANDNTDEEVQCDFVRNCKRKANETNTNVAENIRSMPQKYEVNCTNYNSNSKSKFAHNNNNSIISNNNINNTDNNEFWQKTRLCMQRPITYDQNSKVNNQQEQHDQQLALLPSFYYRQQQFILSPIDQHHQQSCLAPSFPVTQQVCLHLQQHQQAVQKSQDYYSNEIAQSPSFQISSLHTPVASTVLCTSGSSDGNSEFINMRPNEQDNG